MLLLESLPGWLREVPQPLGRVERARPRSSSKKFRDRELQTDAPIAGALIRVIRLDECSSRALQLVVGWRVSRGLSSRVVRITQTVEFFVELPHAVPQCLEVLCRRLVFHSRSLDSHALNIP